MKYIKRGEKAVEGGGAGAVFADPLWEKKHPATYEFLSALVWDDGTPRRGATLLLFVEDGLVKGCLHDREEGRQLWRASDSLQGLLGALEKALVDGSADWRQAKPQGTPRGRKG